MKANEFVKKFGIHEAKIALLYCKSASCGTVFYKNIQVDAEDLKRVIESHKLVKSCGGLDLARKEAHKNCFDFNAPLLKAILDMESCQ